MHLMFLDESGISDPAQQPVLGFGLLKIDDACELTEKLYKKHFIYHSDTAARRKQIFTELKDNPKVITEPFHFHVWPIELSE